MGRFIPAFRYLYPTKNSIAYRHIMVIIPIDFQDYLKFFGVIKSKNENEYQYTLNQDLNLIIE